MNEYTKLRKLLREDINMWSDKWVDSKNRPIRKGNILYNSKDNKTVKVIDVKNDFMKVRILGSGEIVKLDKQKYAKRCLTIKRESASTLRPR